MGWPWFWDFPSEFFWFRSVDQLPRFPLPVWNVTGYRADAFVLFYDGQSAMYGLTILQQWMSSCLQINHSGKHLKKWIVDVHFENLLISSKANPRRPNICKCLLLDTSPHLPFHPFPTGGDTEAWTPLLAFHFRETKIPNFLGSGHELAYVHYQDSMFIDLKQFSTKKEKVKSQLFINSIFLFTLVRGRWLILWRHVLEDLEKHCSWQLRINPKVSYLFVFYLAERQKERRGC